MTEGLFLLLAAVLVVRFLRTGGRAMLKVMDEPMEEHAEHPEQEEEQEYRCPMHPEVRQEVPGRCPKCGMELVPAERAHHH